MTYFISSFSLALMLISGLAQANTPLVKVGEGSAYWGIFKLYDAQFLTEPNLNLEEALSDDTAATIELCYTRSLTVENFIEGANNGLPANLSPQLVAAVNTLHQAYQPVQEGDCYVLSYEPQIGTQLLLNGQSLVKIPTPDFKAVYFGIWVGSNALSDKLKQNLTQGLVAR